MLVQRFIDRSMNRWIVRSTDQYTNIKPNLAESDPRWNCEVHFVRRECFASAEY